MAKSRRLNKEIKGDILCAAIEKAFRAKQNVLDDRRAAIAREIVAEKIGKHAKVFAGLPDDFKYKTANFWVHIGDKNEQVYFNGQGSHHHYGGYENPGLMSRESVQVPVPHCFSMWGNANDIKFPPASAIAKRWFHIQSEQKVLNEEIHHVHATMKGVLDACTTVRKLIEAWPEAEELIPEEVLLPADAPKPLPVVTVDDLNARIGLPTPVAKTAAAA